MSISERLDRPSETWRPADPKDFPTHPQQLVGLIVEIEEVEGDYGVYPLLYIQDDDGNEWKWSVFGGVAQGRLAKLKPKVGDRIGVKYLGEKPSKNFKDRNYRDWKIIVESQTGATAGPDWEAMAKSAEDEVDDF